MCVLRTLFTPTAEELLDIQQRFSTEQSDSHFYIPENFTVTVPAYVENELVDYNTGKLCYSSLAISYMLLLMGKTSYYILIFE